MKYPFESKEATKKYDSDKRSMLKKHDALKKKVNPVSDDTAKHMHRQVTNQFKQEEHTRRITGFYKKAAK